MRRPLLGYASMILSAALLAAACATPEARPSPTPAPTAPSASRPPTPTSPPPTASPTPRPSPPPTTAPSPGSSPAAACPRLAGGNTANEAQLVSVRISHQPGFDRLGFEVGPAQAPGPFGSPAYAIAAATSPS